MLSVEGLKESVESYSFTQWNVCIFRIKWNTLGHDLRLDRKTAGAQEWQELMEGAGICRLPPQLCLSA